MADSPFFSVGGLASGLDTTSIIDGLTKLEQRPLDSLRAQQDGFRTQVSLIGSLVGQIKAVGFTTDAFADAWRDKLREGFMRDPKVSVQVVAYRPVYIFGEVTKPGGYPFAPGMTVRSEVGKGSVFRVSLPE